MFSLLIQTLPTFWAKRISICIFFFGTPTFWISRSPDLQISEFPGPQISEFLDFQVPMVQNPFHFGLVVVLAHNSIKWRSQTIPHHAFTRVELMLNG